LGFNKRTCTTALRKQLYSLGLFLRPGSASASPAECKSMEQMQEGEQAPTGQLMLAGPLP